MTEILLPFTDFLALVETLFLDRVARPELFLATGAFFEVRETRIFRGRFEVGTGSSASNCTTFGSIVGFTSSSAGSFVFSGLRLASGGVGASDENEKLSLTRLEAQEQETERLNI